MQTRKLNRISEKLKLYSNIFFRKFSGAMHRDIAKKEGEVNVLPESLVDLLLNDTYRKYLNTDGTIIQGREENYNAFTWFVESVLKAINHDFTNGEMKKILEEGHPDFISKVNNESRSRACVLHPTKDKEKLANDEMYAARFSSSKRGFSKLPWTKEGILMYNEWMKKIKLLRDRPETGKKLEACILSKFEASNPNKKRNI